MLEDGGHGRATLNYKSTHDPVRLVAIGADSEQTIEKFTTDIPYLTNWGKALLIGPGSILDAHTRARSGDEKRVAAKSGDR